MALSPALETVTDGMRLRPTTAQQAWWSGTLVGSLLMAGCDAWPGASREWQGLNRAAAIAAAEIGLRPCSPPALRPPEASEVLAASHRSPRAIERLPSVPKPFPALASEVPLSAFAADPAYLARSQAQAPVTAARAASPSRPAIHMVARHVEQASHGAEAGEAENPLFPPPPVATPRIAPPQIAAPSNSIPSNAAPRNVLPRIAAPPIASPRHAPPAAAAAPALLPPLAPRSSEIEAVARQAERQVRRGYDLAARGAIYSARSQFIQALRTIAQALDAQAAGRRHTDALAAGLAALEEAEDFVPRGSNVDADLDVGLLIRGHRTPVMKGAAGGTLTALTAQQKYYTFAQQQLSLAAGHEEAGSMALFGLGKAYGTLAAERSPQTIAPEAKAMVFHQAALAVDAGNYLAANELAVFEARYGRFESARALLQHCVTLAPQAAIWKNLARVHRQLGETQLAASAEERAAEAQRRETAQAAAPNANAAAPGEIQWLDAKTFAATSKPASDLQRPAGDRPAEPKAAPPVEATQGLLPWLPRASRPSPSAAQR